MNLKEWETRVHFILEMAVLFCCALGAYSFHVMSVRENRLIDQITSLSVLVDSQAELAKKQAEMARVQGETNRNLSEEIKDIRGRQDLLRRVAERIGVAAHNAEYGKSP